MKKKGLVIGIDLGTSKSVAAIFRCGDKPEVIPNAEGKTITPSFVQITEKGEVIIGDEAKNSAMLLADRSFQNTKRLMGIATESGQSVSCGIVDGKEFTPEMIAGFILKKLKQDAEKYLGEEVTEVVITVPAYFMDAARRATMAAGEIAGLQVRHIINEPTAAALYFGFVNKENEGKTLLVYDLGGGTFDVSILRVHVGEIEVLATKGNRDLGGTDIDNGLMEWGRDAFHEDHGITLDPIEDTAALQDLRDRAERAKITLSKRDKASIAMFARGKQTTREITRAEFESKIKPILSPTMTLTEEALKAAGLTIKQIDKVLLVGGSTRVPFVAKMFEEYYGVAPMSSGGDADLAVAKGAAIAASMLEADWDETGGISTIKDIAPHTLGVEAVDLESGGNRFISAIIPAGSKIPSEATKMYALEKDLQATVHIRVVQGKDGLPTDSPDCEIIGELTLPHLPRKTPREPRIKVTFRYTANGIIEADAVDTVSGISTQGKIELRKGMTAQEIEAAKDEVEGSITT